jgi:hypothetical protein
MTRDVPLAAYEDALRARLAALPRGVGAVVAVASAERLYPTVADWLQRGGQPGGDRADGQPGHDVVRATLDLAWQVLRANASSHPDARAQVERCLALAASAGAAAELPASVDDGIAAAVYALQAAAGIDEEAAGWAARRVTDAIDAYLLAGPIDPAAPDAEQRVWAHPLVRAEVERREADLVRLTTAVDRTAVIDGLRAAAVRSNALPRQGPLADG